MSAAPAIYIACDHRGCTSDAFFADTDNATENGWWVDGDEVTDLNHPTAYCPRHTPKEHQ